MPIAAGEGHCALGVDGACHLETAGQAVHAGGCLPGEAVQAEQWRLLGRAPGMAPYLPSFTPPLLGPQIHCVKTSSLSLLGILEGCCHLGVGWVAGRGLRDKRHNPGQLSQCLQSAFLKAEPQMGIHGHRSIEEGLSGETG